MQRVPRAAALALCCCAVFAQTAAQPAFEVASVKPAAPLQFDGRGGGRGGGRGSPNQVTFTYSPMMSILMNAYGVKRYQISGPEWLDTERFDIVAKLPEGAKRTDSPAMLQTLLAERFKLVAHRETRDLPMYSLTVAKNGPKLKESEPTPATPQDPDAPRVPLPPSDFKMGSDGFPLMPAGRGGSTQTQSMPGRTRIKATGRTIAMLATMLSNTLNRPVIDGTGLTKNYDYILEFAPEPGAMNPFGMILPMQAPMSQTPMSRPVDPGVATEPDAAPSLLTAIQQQLGLKLEAKKGPVELVVIDHIEKIPTEN